MLRKLNVVQAVLVVSKNSFLLQQLTTFSNGPASAIWLINETIQRLIDGEELTVAVSEGKLQVNCPKHKITCYMWRQFRINYDGFCRPEWKARNKGKIN